jgi:hypothetical protein
MAKRQSIKHLQIDKSQSTVLIVIAVSTVFIVFGLFATKSLITKGLYQRRALHAQREAVDKLKANITAANTLITQYKVFAQNEPNLIGGTTDGNGDKDGDNPRIVLDALPSTYDAPALGSSLEKILTKKNITINTLSVTDDPTASAAKAEANPQPQTVTVQIAGSSTYDGITKLLQEFEHSIRPFDINNLQLGGTDKTLQLTASVNTYYQPAKSLDLSITKDVK